MVALLGVSAAAANDDHGVEMDGVDVVAGGIVVVITVEIIISLSHFTSEK